MKLETAEDRRRLVWEALRAKSAGERRPKGERRGRPGYELLSYDRTHDRHSLEHDVEVAGEKLVGHRQNAAFRGEVWDVFFDAIRLGLITPGTKAIGPTTLALTDSFQFTDRGHAHFASEVPLWDSSHMAEFIKGLKSAISRSQATLLLEAQRCWKAACYRAAVVMLGLANEEAVESLLSAVEKQVPQDPSTKVGNAWKELRNTKNKVAARWDAAREILMVVHDQLKAAHVAGKKTKPVWWVKTWEYALDPIATGIDGLRTLRNAAAHDPTHMIERGEVEVLFAGLPGLLQRVAGLRRFLRTPPRGVAVPAV
jgi:hypothetical protein